METLLALIFIWYYYPQMAQWYRKRKVNQRKQMYRAVSYSDFMMADEDFGQINKKKK